MSITMPAVNNKNNHSDMTYDLIGSDQVLPMRPAAMVSKAGELSPLSEQI